MGILPCPALDAAVRLADEHPASSVKRAKHDGHDVAASQPACPEGNTTRDRAAAWSTDPSDGAGDPFAGTGTRSPGRSSGDDSESDSDTDTSSTSDSDSDDGSDTDSSTGGSSADTGASGSESCDSGSRAGASHKDDAFIGVLLGTMGLVVLDEAHHGVARTFCAVLTKLPVRHRLAVTATPRRHDGLFRKMHHLFGPIVFRSFRKTGESKVLTVKYVDPEVKEVKMRNGAPAVQAMWTNLQDRPGWDQLLVATAVHLVTTQGRRVLMVTPRREHVKVLAEKVAAALAPHAETLQRTASITTRAKTVPKTVGGARPKASEFCDRPTYLAALKQYRSARAAWLAASASTMVAKAALASAVPAGTPHETRALLYEANVVVATFSLLKEGVSYPGWDTLILAAPVKDPEQVVGRTQCPGPTKRIPLVIDVWTDVSLFAGLHWSRVGFYRSEHMDVQHVAVGPGETLDPARLATYNQPFTFERK